LSDVDGRSMVIDVYDLSYGEEVILNTNGGSSSEAIVDLSSRFVRVPHDVFSTLKEKLPKEAFCSSELCYFEEKCHHVKKDL
jgi:hypothetical protein